MHDYKVKVGFFRWEMGQPVKIKMFWTTALRLRQAVVYYLERLETDPEFRAAQAHTPVVFPDDDEVDVAMFRKLESDLYEVAHAAFMKTKITRRYERR